MWAPICDLGKEKEIKSMKIKRKVEMNLPQLIEWLLESGKSECIVISNMNNIVRLEPYGVIRFSQEKFYPEEIFTVEVDEEITEDTVIPKVLNVFKNTTNRIRNDEESHIRRNVSVKEIKENSRDYIENDRLYIMNDDLTMTLIWHDGKLVE